MNTEIMAVSFLKLAIAKTAYLVPHINEGDREPSWDGDIEVYSRPGAHHSKADLVQKVPIQVKGRSVVKISQKQTTSFPIDISDLQNFLTAGGTIFFVIDVDKTGDHAQIYYSCLLPYELRKILAKYGKQKTRNMPLVAFPKESDSIANVLLNCAQDIKKQRTAITADMVTLETLVQAGSVPELSFGYIQVPSDNSVPFEYLFDHDTHLYATLPFGVVLPIEKMGQIDVAYTEIEAPVSIDGQLFYDRYLFAYKRDCYELCFGKSTKLVHYYNLVLDTIHLAMKKEKKRVAAELQLHSDQGFQYTSQAYYNLTQSYGITPSMSRRGNCYDNAMAENFFSILKTECIYRHKLTSFRLARSLIESYIAFYNSERIQSKTGAPPLSLRHSC